MSVLRRFFCLYQLFLSKFVICSLFVLLLFFWTENSVTNKFSKKEIQGVKVLILENSLKIIEILNLIIFQFFKHDIDQFCFFRTDWVFNTIKTPQCTSDVTDDQNTVRVKSETTRPSISASHLSRSQEMSPNSTIINRNNDSVSYSILDLGFFV